MIFTAPKLTNKHGIQFYDINSVVDRLLTWEILEGISFVKWDGEERLVTVSQ